MTGDSRNTGLRCFMLIVALSVTTGVHAASITVAPSDASDKVKSRADYVCDGKDDQVELLASLTEAGKSAVPTGQLDKNGRPTMAQCLSKHSVEWLGGNYNLSSTLVIPDCADVVIQAEAARLSYVPDSGDAIVINGMLRCRYYFGTFQTNTSGAAIRIRPTAVMPAQMSIVGFAGLMGTKHKGTGLYLDSSLNNISRNKFDGTNICGLETGYRVGTFDTAGTGRCNANWLWASFIYDCTKCVWEGGHLVHDNAYYVNLEANARDSVCARTGATNGRWYIINGTGDWYTGPKRADNQTRSLILDPGATNNVFEIHPPLEGFAPVDDKSGNKTNIIMTTSTPPLKAGAGGQGSGVGKVSGDR